jgi:hypothetical protein
VYNTTFFTPDFEALKTVYPSYDVMVQRICADIRALDNELAYSTYQSAQHDVCARYYDYEHYVHNVRSYYARYFSSAGASEWAASASE